MSSAYAQSAPADDRIEEITVTGSRIVRKDYETTSPVFTLDSRSLQDAGTPQIEQVLNELPQLVPTITTTSNNPSNGGMAFVDMRGLGAGRTLVLMDGARLQPSTTAGLIDLNTIPAGLIESVEIVTGGGSAVYGSDAIAGVKQVATAAAQFLRRVCDKTRGNRQLAERVHVFAAFRGASDGTKALLMRIHFLLKDREALQRHPRTGCLRHL